MIKGSCNEFSFTGGNWMTEVQERRKMISTYAVAVIAGKVNRLNLLVDSLIGLVCQLLSYAGFDLSMIPVLILQMVPIICG